MKTLSIWGVGFNGAIQFHTFGVGEGIKLQILYIVRQDRWQAHQIAAWHWIDITVHLNTEGIDAPLPVFDLLNLVKKSRPFLISALPERSVDDRIAYLQN